MLTFRATERRRPRRSPLGNREVRPRWTRDEATGLMNAGAFEAVGAYALRRAGRFGEPAGLICIDLGAFSRPPEGIASRTLSFAAGRICDATRGEDVLGRTGTSELAVLVLGTAGEATAALVGRLERALADLPSAAGAAGAAAGPSQPPGPARFGWTCVAPGPDEELVVASLLSEARRQVDSGRGGEGPDACAAAAWPRGGSKE